MQSNYFYELDAYSSLLTNIQFHSGSGSFMMVNAVFVLV